MTSNTVNVSTAVAMSGLRQSLNNFGDPISLGASRGKTNSFPAMGSPISLAASCCNYINAYNPIIALDANNYSTATPTLWKDSSGRGNNFTINAAAFSNVNGINYMNFTNPTIGSATIASGTNVPIAIGSSSISSDPYFTYVTLLLHFDGNIVDSSIYGNTLTTSGTNATISSTQYQFGSSSLYMNNSPGCLYTPSRQWFGTNNFTVEFWMYCSSVSGTQGYGGRIFGNNSFIEFGYNNWNTTTYNFFAYFDVALTTNCFYGNLNYNTWYHIACVRNGNSCLCYLNGNLVGTYTFTQTSVDSTSYPLYIGTIAGTQNNSNSWYGYIDEIRVTCGIARYTGSSFTVPSSAFPNATTTVDPYFGYVTLLMHCQGVNGGTTFTDSSSYAQTITNVGGTITTSTSSYQFPTSSFYSSGASGNNYLLLPTTSSLMFGTNNFTIEFWINPSAPGSTQRVMGNIALGNWASGMWGIGFNAGDNKIHVDINGVGTPAFFAPTTMTAGVWYHVAVVRNGNTFTMFQNGVAGTSITYSGNFDPGASSTYATKIGWVGDVTTSTASYFNGYLQDIRFTNGIARYTSNFTIPASAFPNYTVQAYPPSSLATGVTGTNPGTTVLSAQSYGNGTYITSSSSLYSFAGVYPYTAFNKNPTTLFWASSASYPYGTTSPYQYTGSTTTAGIYSGEWLQIQLPSVIVLTSYAITCYTANYQYQAPGAWYMLGSNDGTNWYLCDYRSGITWTSASQVQTFATTNTTGYSYYRIVINCLDGYTAVQNPVAVISQLVLNCYTPLSLPGTVNGMTVIAFSEIQPSNAASRTLIRDTIADAQVTINAGTNSLGMYDATNASGFNATTNPTALDVSTISASNTNFNMLVVKGNPSTISPYMQVKYNNQSSSNYYTNNSSVNSAVHATSGIGYIGGSNNTQLWGNIGLTLIYNSILTEPQIQDIYNRFAPRFLFNTPPVTSNLIGYYTGESWTGTQWTDLSGNANHAITTTGTIRVFNNTQYDSASVAYQPLNGLKYIGGGTSAGITFPAAILPQTYTLLWVARYAGVNETSGTGTGSNQRIFDATTTNWFSGFSNATSAIAQHNGTFVTQSTSNIYALPQNWIIASDQTNVFRSFGSNLTITSPNASYATYNLTINNGAYKATQASDWMVATVLVYSRELLASELNTMEMWLAQKYNLTTYMRLHQMNKITSTSYAACVGAYGTYLLNAAYTGPILKIRNTANVIMDFYADVNGNITIAPNNTGQTLAAWITATGGGSAYIDTWYDQSGSNNHAKQNATYDGTAYQPIFDTTNNMLSFRANAGLSRMKLPDGTVPYGDSSYTVVVKHNTASGAGTSPTLPAFLGSGASTTNNLNAFGIDNRAGATSNNYINYWWGNDYDTNTSCYASANVVTFNYTTGSYANRNIFVNGTTQTVAQNSGGVTTVRASTNANNYIGFGDSGDINYLNGELYNIYIFNTKLPYSDQNIIEQTPFYIAPITGLASSSIAATSMTLSWTNTNGYQYTILSWNSGANTVTILANTSTFSNFTSTNVLLPNVTYTFTLTPYYYLNTTGNSATAAVGKAYTTAAATLSAVTLPTVSGFALSSAAANSLTVGWTAAGTPATYNYVVISWSPATTGTPSSQITAASAITSYTTANANLATNTAYSITITPYNSAASPGTATTLTNQYTLAGALSGSATASLSGAFATITWSDINVPAATSYNISWAGGSGTSSTTSYTTGALNAGTYTFTITPVNVSGTPNAGGSIISNSVTYAGSGGGGGTTSVATPLVASSAPSVQDLINTTLLLSFNGANNSTLFTDFGPNNQQFAIYGNPTLTSRIQAKFGPTCAYFPGGSYIQSSTNIMNNIGNKNFSIEFWFNWNGINQNPGYPQTIIANNNTYTTPNAFNQAVSSAANATLVSTVIPSSYTNTGAAPISQNSWSIGLTDVNNGQYSKMAFQFYNQIPSMTIATQSTVPQNQWNHYAFCRNSSNIYAYVNGILETQAVIPNYTFIDDGINPSTLYIGCGFGNQYLYGYLDDMRIMTNIAKYTSSFTVPDDTNYDPLDYNTTLLIHGAGGSNAAIVDSSVFSTRITATNAYIPAVATAGGPMGYDPYYNNVVLLLHGNGPPNSQVFTDSSQYNAPITVNGTPASGGPVISNGTNPYTIPAGSAPNFNSAMYWSTITAASTTSFTNFLITPQSPNYNFGLQDFTIECWIYIISLTGFKNYGIISNSTATGTNCNWVLYHQSGVFVASVPAGPQIYNNNYGTGQWYHLAFTRKNNFFNMFVNGSTVNTQSTNTTTISIDTFTTANYLQIGQYGDCTNSANCGNQLIADLRVTIGICRYTANFPVPTSPFPNYNIAQYPLGGSSIYYPVSTSDPYYANVVLLLHFDSNYTDSSLYNATMLLGSAPPAIAYRYYKFGGGSMALTGVANNYIYTPTAQQYALLSNNFTIEFWIYVSSASSNPGIMGNYFSGTYSNSGGNWVFWITTTNTVLNFQAFSSSVTLSTNLTLSTWQYVAVVRNGSFFTMYLNGVNVSTNTNTAAITSTLTDSIYVGDYAQTSLVSISGYLDDVRVTNGIARYTSNFTPPIAPAYPVLTNTLTPSPYTYAPSYTASYAASYDPFFGYVTLLLHGNGSAADSSVYGTTMTTTGTLTYGTAKFGTNSFSFNGTSFISTPQSSQFGFGTNNFTIEFWFYSNDTSGQHQMMGNNTPNAATNNPAQWNLYNKVGTSKITLYAYGIMGATNGGDAWTGTNTFSTGVWNHYALVRNGNVLTAYLNGVQDGTYTSTNGFDQGGKQYLSIGGSGYNTAALNCFNGFIDDIRITNGIARYTANFTIPTTEFPNSAPIVASDPYFANVNLLLHFDGTSGTATFTDSSSYNVSLTAFGTTTSPTISSTQQKFGPTSLYVNGTQTVYTPASAVNIFGTNNFTIECWFYPTSYSSAPGIISNILTAFTTDKWAVTLTNAGYPQFWVYDISGGSVAFLTTTTAVTLNAWSHIAVTRNGSTFYLFLNGAQLTTGTSSSSLDTTNGATTSTIVIGGEETSNAANPYMFSGYIDEVRITNGIARYTANFAVPTAPFPAVSSLTDPYFANVTLLLHADNNTTDSSSYNYTLTTTGTVPYSTTYFKLGTASFSFSGSVGNFLTTPALPGFGTNNFTVEMFIYCNANISNQQRIFGNYSTCMEIGWNSGGNLFAYLNVSSTTLSFGTISQNQWYHVAVVRNGTVVTAYLNGNSINTYTINTAAIDNASSYTFDIGNSGYRPQDTNCVFYGYIDEVRITNGAARYTAAFTPPVTPFPNVAASTLNTISTITTNSSPLFAFSYCDFTIEFWMNWSGSYPGTGYVGIMTTSAITPTLTAGTNWLIASTSTGAAVGTNTFTLSLKIGSNNVTTPTIYANTWTHVAFTRSGSTFSGFANGVSGGSTTYTGTMDPGTSTQIIIGAATGYNPTCVFNGYIEEVRITRGLARYTGTTSGTTYFTPSSVQFMPLGNTIPEDPTVLLMHCDGANNGTVFTDSSVYNTQLLTIGSPTTSTTTYKYGTASLNFNGSSVVYTPPSQIYTLGTQDFTMEYWFNTPTIAPVQPDNVSPSLVDPYFNNVVLLLHADRNFNDSSQYNATLTLTGSVPPAISTTQSKFGGTSILYTKLNQNNPGQNAMTPLSSIYYLGYNNFTIECWIYFNSITSYSFSVLSTVAGTNQAGFSADANAARVTFYGGGGSVYQSGVSTGTWHHIAVSRLGNTFYAYYDGAAPNNGGSTWTSTLPVGGTGIDQIAAGCPPGGGYTIDGYLDEIRVTNGYARYTTPFTIPTAAFPNIGVTYSVPRLIGNGVGTSISTGSWNFYITPSTQTISAYAYNASAAPTIMQITSTNIIQPNTWYHIALVRNQNTFYLYLNGILQGTQTWAYPFDVTGYNATNAIYIGWSGNATDAYFTGYIDELRIMRGVAKYTANFQVQTSPYPSAQAYDISNASTILLLHADGPNNSTNIIDSSYYQSTVNNANAVTTTSYVTLSTAQSVFGGSSLYFNGSAYLSLTSSPFFTFGSQDFTIEFWVNISNFFAPMVIMGNWIGTGTARGGGGWMLYTNISGNLLLVSDNAGTGSSTPMITSSTTLFPAVWYHVALVRNGISFYMFINGILNATYTNSFTNNTTTYSFDSNTAGTYASNPLYIGYSYYSSSFTNNYLTGYIDELRVTRGIARYKNNFVPPQSPFQPYSAPLQSPTTLLLHFDGTNSSSTFIDSSPNNAIVTYSSSGDAYYSNVVLLIHGNGSFIDNSQYNATITATNNPLISTSVYKYGGSSIYFSNTSATSYISTPSSTNYAFGTNNFTIEFWMNWSGLYSTSGSGWQRVMTNTSGGSMTTNVWLIGWGTTTTNGTAQIAMQIGNVSGSPIFTAFAPILANIWTHYAFVRVGAYLYIYVNGIIQSANNMGSTSISLDGGVACPIISGGVPGASQYFFGYMNDIRLTNTVARYTPNFTAPAAIFPSSAASDVYYPYVTLLLHFDNTVLDSSQYLTTFTNSSSPPFITTTSGQYKYGTGALSCTASTACYMYTPTQPYYAFGTNSFTIEFWLYITSVAASSYYSIMANTILNTTFSVNNWAIWIYSTAQSVAQISFTCYNINGNSNANFQVPITTGVYNHIALVRNGTGFSLYVNGALIACTISPASFDGGGANAIYIGANLQPVQSFVGYIDEVRITNGIARYTGNFTPPTGLFPNTAAASAAPTITTAVTSPVSSAVANFTGSQNTYITIPPSQLYSLGTNNNTIEFWMNPTTTFSLFGTNIIGNYYNSTSFVATNLIAYYDISNVNSYNPQNPNIIKDMSGNGYNLTLYNGVGYNTAPLSLSWSSTTYGNLTGITPVINLTYFTFEALVYCSAFTAAPSFISLYNGSTGINIYISATGAIGLNAAASTSTPCTINTWLHIVISYTNSTTVSAYVNGVSYALSGTFPSIPANINQIIIGNYYPFNAQSYGPPAPAKIAMARIYNTPLTATQVSQNYNSARASIIMYPLDVLSAASRSASTLAGAYSVYRLLTSYTGPVIRLQDATPVTQDFYPDTSQNLWTGPYGTGSTLATWATGRTGIIIVIFYDQSGNGKHLVTSISTATYPTFSTTNKNLVFNGTSSHISVLPGLFGPNATKFTYYCSVNITSSVTPVQTLMGADSLGRTNASRASLWIGNGGFFSFIGESNDVQVASSISLGATKFILRCAGAVANNIDGYVNGVYKTSVSSGAYASTAVSNGLFMLGAINGPTGNNGNNGIAGGEYFGGTMTTALAWNTYLPQNDTNLLVGISNL